MAQPKFRYVVLPVTDVAASAAFYEALGCRAKRTDGTRWAEVASDHVAISLCGPEDTKRPSEPAFAVMVDNLDATLASLEQLGGTVKSPRSGSTATVEDPDGNLVMLFQTGS